MRLTLDWQINSFLSPNNNHTPPSSSLTLSVASDLDDESLRFCETSLSVVGPQRVANPLIPKIKINRQSTYKDPVDYSYGDGLLHAPDTCLDFLSRNALHRHRSFIEHIREIPGIEGTSGRFVTAKRRSQRREMSEEKRKTKKKRPRHVSKYFIGLSSDDEEDEIEEMIRGGVGIELLPFRGGSNQLLTVGTSSASPHEYKRRPDQWTEFSM